MFCQLESIRQCIKLNSLRRALSTLPKTLDQTYERILQGLETRTDFDDTVTALQWLCYSHRPLTFLELREELAIETGEHGGFLPDDRLRGPADIMELCSSLISCQIVTGDEPEDDLEIELPRSRMSDD